MFRRFGASAGLAAALLLCAIIAHPGTAEETGETARSGTGPRGTGPDIICSQIYGWRNWGVENGIAAISIGTRSCNIGSLPVSWRIGTPDFPDSRHPIIAQNLYRLTDGRFEQIGQSWLKHGFCAVDGDDFCTGCVGNGTCTSLAVGCSDPYSSSLNGTQIAAGPKYEVNPSNGSFPYPPSNPEWTGITARRLQVRVLDLPEPPDPGGTPRAQEDRYFVAAQYIAADESIWGNDLNNSAYREVNMDQQGIEGYLADTVAELPAIYAWQDADPGVQIVVVDIPNDGRFYFGFRATLAMDNLYDYEYALLNYNSDRAARSFAVPAAASTGLSSIEFHDVRYHSGEPFDNTDWTQQYQDDVLRWFGEVFEINSNANALRWGTMYNFRFRSPRPPRPVDVQMELFKPHATPIVNIAAIAPTPREDVTVDGVIDSADVVEVLERWSTANKAADVDENNIVDVFDLLAVLRAWGL